MSAALTLTETVGNLTKVLRERPPQHWLLNRVVSEIDQLGRKLPGFALPNSHEIAICLTNAMGELTAAHGLPEGRRFEATSRAIEQLGAAVGWLSPAPPTLRGRASRPMLAVLRPGSGEVHSAAAAAAAFPLDGPLPLSARRQAMPDRAATPCVLIVERDETVRSLQRYFLERAGLAVEFADDGEAAWERVLRDPPALVVTEILVPRLDGLALCRRVREEPQTRTIPVIVLSILSAGQRAGEAGATAFLRKPLVDSTFVAAVQDLITAQPNSVLEHQWPST
jgi:CheY-like chemotaxis protein